jgi:hypothetical protein
MAEVNETDEILEETFEEDTLTWWTKWRVPAAPVILAIALVVGTIVYVLFQQNWDRAAAARAACENQAEFRSFFAGYLQDQIGTPIEDIPGFDQLSPEARAFAIQLAPVVEAEREQDQKALAEYIANFPIPNCAQV